MTDFNTKLDKLINNLSGKYSGAIASAVLAGDTQIAIFIMDKSGKEFKQAIIDLILSDVIGEGELHYSHLCPPDSIGCAKFQQREQTRHYQLLIINGKESNNE